LSVINLDNLSLSYSLIGEGDPLVFLPGIMGNKKNWQLFATRLLKELPNYSALIFDLRNHGESSKHCEPFTIRACADDVVQAVKKLSLNPHAIFGHSFGGKVGFLAGKKLEVPQIWLLDCPFGEMDQKPLGESLTAFDIINKLKKLSWPQKSRNDVVEELLKLKVPRPISLWMSTNLREEQAGYFLNFYPDEVEKMLEDFIKQDLWPEVSSANKSKIHLVMAEHGQRVSLKDKEKLEQVSPNSFFHVLKNSGHFVHVDNPDGLIKLIREFV
jgi:pimeloyl-ACP methyl ester carboxylesterase